MLGNLKGQVESLELIPSGGGVFELMAGDELLFSKKKENRFPEDNEVVGLFK